MNKLAIYLAQLVKAQLNNIVPQDLPNDIEVNKVIDIARKNQMVTLLLGGLIKTNISENDKERIRPIIKQSIFKSLVQYNELTVLQKQFEKEAVVNQPMKGAYLKKIYPQINLREMGDIDILIREDCFEKSENILINQLGYHMDEDVKHHVVYSKGPMMILEVHYALYDKNVDKKQYEYFSDFSKAKLNKGCVYSYNFSEEDFYIYMMAHMAKHFYEKGCGIRNLVDIFVYRNHYKNQLDEEYMERELERCGILSFTRNMEELTEIWLNEKEGSEFFDHLFTYMLEGGVYGKSENGIWNEYAKEHRNANKLILFYFFPPMHYMEHYYPWIHNCKILLPIAWVKRLVHGVFSKDGKERMNMINNIEADKIAVMQEIYRRMKFNFNNN